MSISMNKSSEATTQLNLPISYIINSSLLDDCSLNSIYSPRPGSVTVIGKRVFSNSCISPNIIEEAPKFPIPIKSITRLKRQNNQVKLLLSKKSPKLKFPENPVPTISKPTPKQNFSIIKVKTKEKLKKKTEKKIEFECIKPTLPLETKQDLTLTERSPKRIRKIMQKSIKLEKKNKKKLEKNLNREKKVKKFKKLCLEERNSRIRVENSTKFKMEKFTPRAAWGIDERKLDGKEKVLKDIEIQRQLKRVYKSSPEYTKRKALGLSHYWEVAEEIGFRPRSSSIPKLDLPIAKVKKSQDPKVKKFIILQKKREKQRIKNKIIEDVQKETKRLTGLKILDLKQYSSEIKQRRVKKSVNIEIRPKRILFNQGIEEDAKKVSDEKSSDFEFEPDSALKQELSGFSQDSDPAEIEEVPPEPDHEYIRVSAAIKIQYFLRKFLKKRQKKLSDSMFTDEDTEVQNILISWNASQSDLSKKENETKSALNSDQLNNLEKMRQKEINELIELTKQLSQDPKVIDSLTEMIGNRYQNIAEMLQDSCENSEPSQSLERNTKDLGMNKESQFREFYFPLNKLEKSFQEHSLTASTKRHPSAEFNERPLNPGEIMVFQELQIDNQLIDKDESFRCELNPFKYPLISFPNELNLSEEDINEKVGNQLSIITPEFIQELAESVVSRLLVEVVSVSHYDTQLNNIDKDVGCYINQIILLIPELEFCRSLSLPLIHLPNQLLMKMQDSSDQSRDTFLPSNCPNIIPVSTFKSLDSSRQSLFTNKSLRDSQKAHDRLIYDCLNECLQTYRPYGLSGEPAPWSYNPRCLSKEHKSVGSIFDELKEKLEKESEFAAGKICDSSFCLNSSSIEEEGVQNLREEKIGILILKNIEENEHLWVNYTYEEAQASIEVADWVFEWAILEALNIIMGC